MIFSNRFYRGEKLHIPVQKLLARCPISFDFSSALKKEEKKHVKSLEEKQMQSHYSAPYQSELKV